MNCMDDSRRKTLKGTSILCKPVLDKTVKLSQDIIGEMDGREESRAERQR